MIDITKTYRTRDGREVTNLRMRSGYTGDYPIRGIAGDIDTSFTLGGHFYSETQTDNRDLIEVAPTPAPAPTSTFDPTKPVRQRNGRPARIICTDRKNARYPIMALLTDSQGNEVPVTRKIDGQFQTHERETDLVNIPERWVHFVNLGLAYTDSLGTDALLFAATDNRGLPVLEIVTEGGTVVSTTIHPALDASA